MLKEIIWNMNMNIFFHLFLFTILYAKGTLLGLNGGWVTFVNQRKFTYTHKRTSTELYVHGSWKSWNSNWIHFLSMCSMQSVWENSSNWMKMKKIFEVSISPGKWFFVFFFINFTQLIFSQLAHQIDEPVQWIPCIQYPVSIWYLKYLMTKKNASKKAQISLHHSLVFTNVKFH